MKEDIKLENYLLTLEPKYAIPITKFRASNHRLPIVQGRYEGRPVEERVCPLCNTGQVGDESHYILHCSHFHEDRDHFIPPLPGTQSYNIRDIFANTNMLHLKRLSLFVAKIMRAFHN